MDDVLIVGAGPAGAIAAIVLAREGAHVRLIDRATFPRHKLCGDTLNPGALALLGRLGLAAAAETQGLRVDGMRLTGPGGVTVEGRYPAPRYGVSLSRSALDFALVRAAAAAGVDVIEGTAVRAPIISQGLRGASVVGVSTGANGRAREFRAPVTIAADGRRSTLAFALGLARHPRRPRRWAIGAYAENVAGMSSFGEMHIRRGRYIGVAPLPDGVCNVCLVKPASSFDRTLRDPLALLRAELAADPKLRERFAGARFVSPPHVLGPLAVDAVSGVPVPEGLLLAGDAAGFVDPMTGDGLRFAIRGAELAALAALRALAHGWAGVNGSLEATRQEEFAGKWRFNRVVRSLVALPWAVSAATLGARVTPGVARALILHAGDCGVAATSLRPSRPSRAQA